MEKRVDIINAMQLSGVNPSLRDPVEYRKSGLSLNHIVGQLSIQRTLNQLLGQLLEDAVSTDQVFRILVVGQELIQQLVGDGMLRLAHGVSGSERQCRS